MKFTTYAPVFLLALWLTACGSATQTTVLSIAQLDCATCGEAIATKLSKQEGIDKATFDKNKVELRVVGQADLDIFAMAEPFAKAEKVALIAGAGKGSYLPPKAPPTKADVKTVVEGGSTVPKLSDVVVAGKITVIEFGAVWCGPCRVVDAHMFGLLAKQPDLAYRKLDVGDWGTPLADHYLAKISKLPYIIVFDAKGKKIEAIAGLSLERLDAAIAKARQGNSKDGES